MSTKNAAIDSLKKPASAEDWHPADIVAAVKKLNSSVHRLSRQNGYSNGSLSLALRRPWPKGERIIAEFIGVTPQDIWPSRYHDDGTAKSGRGERGLGRGTRRLTRDKTKRITGSDQVNVYVKGHE